MLLTLLTILLFEGFVTISVEILTMRQLMPFYGGSVVITSIIIGFFLLFLALGYRQGGIHRDRVFERLSHNYLLSMLWIGVGLSYSFIAVFSYVTINTLSLPVLFSLTLYLLCVLAPIVYWLGQTIPLTTNLFNQNQRVSKISGRTLFLSTLGSFLGALVTSLILFQYLGVAWTVVINCLLLFILTLKLKAESKLVWWKYVLPGVSLLLIKNLNVDSEFLRFKLTNNYANYQIENVDKSTRILKINESNSSMITVKNQAFPYAEFIRHMLFDELAIKNKQLLIIGAGGFSLTAAGTNDNHVTYVDIDPDIKQVAETYFLNKAITGDFIGQDARSYLNQTRAKFDVIISDVYSNQIAIPPSLLTVEYFQQLATHLTPSGLLLVNIIASPLFQNAYSRRLDNTIRRVFPHCAVYPFSWNTSLSNIIYICPHPSPDTTAYTDNLSSATFDSFTNR